MGLGQARRRAKLAHDPNNTAWSRSSTTYGHKILQSHGWTPGSFLGARHAVRSVSPSVAKLPEVKIVLKDDNLGLGARGGVNCGNERCTGLDVFQGILGRLNGQNEPQSERKRKLGEDQMNNVNQERPIRFVRFVSGGFLGGTRKEEPKEEHMMKPISLNKESLLTADDGVQQVQTQLECEDSTTSHTEPWNPREPKSSWKRRARGDRTVTNGSKLSGGEQHSCTIPVPDDQGNHKKKSSSVIDSVPLDLHTAARRVDKAERKLKKRKKRETEQATLVEKQKTLVDVPAGFHPKLQSLNTFDPAVMLDSVPRTSQPLEGRHAVRQRYIRQKKMAIMDSKALNEVRRELKKR
ncbi:telomerase inhibitor [Sticta canariensis]|nr:telomerase inhibitor [Sticta canariensis]